MSMLKLRSNFEAVVYVDRRRSLFAHPLPLLLLPFVFEQQTDQCDQTSGNDQSIAARMCPVHFSSTVRCLLTQGWQPERLVERALCVVCLSILCSSRCESKPDDEATAATSSIYSSVTLPTNHDRHAHHHARSSLKTSALLNSTSGLTATQHQELLTRLIRLENHKKSHLSSSTLAGLLQTPIHSQHVRSLSNDSNDSLQPKLKRFKGSDSSISNNLSSKKLQRKLNNVSDVRSFGRGTFCFSRRLR